MVSCGIAVSLTVAFPCAAGFWERSFTEWKRDQVLKLLGDSPWAKQVVLTSQVSGRGLEGTARAGSRGERESYYVYTVRFFSALPVRHAYVRMMQIMNDYDEMPPAEQRAFDAQFSRALTMDTSGEIIVALEFGTNDRPTGMDVERVLKTTTAEQLKQNVFLISDRLGRVDLLSYFPPAPDGTGAKFIFPRRVDGKEVVVHDDRDVKFEFYVPGVDHKVLATWKVADLIYQGDLAL